MFLNKKFSLNIFYGYIATGNFRKHKNIIKDKKLKAILSHKNIFYIFFETNIIKLKFSSRLPNMEKYHIKEF